MSIADQIQLILADGFFYKLLIAIFMSGYATGWTFKIVKQIMEQIL